MPNYKKYFIIPAAPMDLYNAFTKEATARLWTGDIAHIDPQIDGEFSLFDESIVGRFLELEEGKKIVQEWYFGEQETPSIATLKFHEHKQGTSFEINHTNIPDEAYEDITEGWESVIIENLLDFYEEG